MTGREIEAVKSHVRDFAFGIAMALGGATAVNKPPDQFLWSFTQAVNEIFLDKMRGLDRMKGPPESGLGEDELIEPHPAVEKLIREIRKYGEPEC